MKIKEIKRIDTDKLRNMCINNNWYTAGNTADYNKMFKMCQKDNISTNQLFKITKDIYEHTNVEKARQGCNNEYSDNENILNMMIYVNDCTYVFYELAE
ncbi:hypothetical protein D3Z47_12165 [Lachnospiraceae bacterium]|nr:hypothetical protein [Lachnospiraceae bacterium]